MSGFSLLAGPPPQAGAESLADHRRRLGGRPAGGPDLIETLHRSGLTGRGGASFPAAIKWRTVASAGGPAVVVANGAEGEPLSGKDQLLMAARPHLVLDGAVLAAESVGARRIILYVGEGHRPARAAMAAALGERPAAERSRIELAAAPAGYVSGEESAAVHFVNEGVAAPVATPPRVFERGVGGRPTVVQNVETLAHAALIARFGDSWFRSLGRGEAAGTVLLTVSGAVAAPAVVELPAGAVVEEAIALAGGVVERPRALLLGGYFGGWVDAAAAPGLALDPVGLRGRGLTLGCGVLHVLGSSTAPLPAVAGVVGYLAAESAAQCGPCFFGLRSLAEATARISSGHADPADLDRVHRWTAMVRGRGACRHPDGAAGFLSSALEVFAPEYGAAAGRRRVA